MFVKTSFSVFLLIVGFFSFAHSQQIFGNRYVLEELLRQSQLEGTIELPHSFLQRPIKRTLFYDSAGHLQSEVGMPGIKGGKNLKFFPIDLSYRFNPDNLPAYGDGIMTPTAGHQIYFSTGLLLKVGILEIQLQPELIFAENSSYDGFNASFDAKVTETRFIYWNNGDFPERFGNDAYRKFWWGQSKIGLATRHLELYIGTSNLRWGPGQFNQLTIGGNAPGFLHASINSVEPLKSPIGDFEFQIISGRLENSLLESSQHPEQNQVFFRPFETDWRYLNAINVSWSPKWLPNLSLGFSRTFQINKNLLEDSFVDYFPIFEAFQKKRFFENGNSVEFDQKGYDQQVAVSSRIAIPEGNFEIYFEYGRRDHAFNWRDFILTPEHARAYLFGFQKLIDLPGAKKNILIRSEVVHQQESVNRYVRYLGLGGNLTWHLHGIARGFTNEGQGIGVGLGPGSNMQLIEIALTEGITKYGVTFSRIVQNQDFFNRAFGQFENPQPWIDFNSNFSARTKIGNTVVGLGYNLTLSSNRQWKSYLNPIRPFGNTNYSFHQMIQINWSFQI
jgi:hypothetical protein